MAHPPAGSARLVALLAVIAAIGCSAVARDRKADEQTGTSQDWTAYGGDPGGSRFSSLAQISRENVHTLVPAWQFSTGDLSHEARADAISSGATPDGCGQCHSGSDLLYKFETTPLLADGRLLLNTPLNRVIAVHPRTGEELWRFDPEVRQLENRAEGYTSRGIAYWVDPKRTDGGCRQRVFLATIDAQLIAVDAETGRRCRSFGDDGVVALDRDVGDVLDGMYTMTSPPVPVGDLVIVGSAIADGLRVESERGTVRAYDARDGSLRWAWDPIPRTPDDAGWDTWTPDGAQKTGAANAWAPISADPERDMVFVPTGSASPDFYGGTRPGQNLFANSVVALRASTGEILWHFQAVHHDVWDYDIPAQPSLVTISRDGEYLPAVAVSTKMGHLFILDRLSGEPLFPVEERQVPTSTVPGEATWPTQPFPEDALALHPHRLTEEDIWGLTPDDREACLQELRGLRNEGIFTPPSFEGTVLFPGILGGANWGSAAFDPDRQLLVTNLNMWPWVVQLHPRPEGPEGQRYADGSQLGTPYTMSRRPLMSPSGLPCSKPPWGTLVAVDLSRGQVTWQTPLGQEPWLLDHPGSEAWGTLNLGGPIVTAGGLVFIAAARDDALHAFDVDTGEMLWKAQLPAGGQATPMTYALDGKQYVVIVAGGHKHLGTTYGDQVVAFSLP